MSDEHTQQAEVEGQAGRRPMGDEAPEVEGQLRRGQEEAPEVEGQQLRRGQEEAPEVEGQAMRPRGQEAPEARTREWESA